LNTPNNPTGKVFDRDELELIASLCRDHDLIAVTDEVYEHLIFEGAHRPLATFDGMRERTVTISSAGKTFSVTGWKIGWACATAPLVAAVQTAKQFLTFAGGTPFQHAIAAGLALSDGRLAEVRQDLRMRRDLFCDGMADLGFDVLAPASGYFATVDLGSAGVHDAVEFCDQLPERCGVVGIPSQVFYEHPDDARTLVRFAFCKSTPTLEEALRRLAKVAPPG
jgi:N-succinyldiaminopimelate aminotransferase